MKRKILLSALSIVFGLLLLNAATAIGLQEKPSSPDDVALLKKTNASLKSQLSKQRTLLLKQIQQNDSGITKLKAMNARQQAAISDLQKTVSDQQAALNSIPAAINQRSHVFGTKRTVAIISIIGAFLVALIYMLVLTRRITAFNESLKKLEGALNEKLAQSNAEMKEHVSRQVSDMKATVERQTTENKNRVIALLADTNQIVHKMGDEINKGVEFKIASLQTELGKGVEALSERMEHLNHNKSL